MENTITSRQIQSLIFLAEHTNTIKVLNPQSNAYFPHELMRLALHYGHAHDSYGQFLMECDIARGTLTLHGNLCRVEIGLTWPSAVIYPRDTRDMCFELTMSSAACVDTDGEYTLLGLGQHFEEHMALAHAIQAIEYFDRALEAMHNTPTIKEREMPQ